MVHAGRNFGSNDAVNATLATRATVILSEPRCKTESAYLTHGPDEEIDQ